VDESPQDSPSSMHGVDDETERLARRVMSYVLDRVRMSPPPLDAPRSPTELQEATGDTITPEGLGWEKAFDVFTKILAPACISSDHPRYLGFVPTAPSEAATLFDLVVSASSIYGDWWIEGAGAIHAENQVLRWLGSVAGFPPGAGGVFVGGGTAGNLAAVTVARETWRRRHGSERAALAVAPSAHSSVRLAAMVTDVPLLLVEPDGRGRLTGDRLEAAIASSDQPVFAVVASGGDTNAGLVDDLAGVADVCVGHDCWMHVDAAYGGAAMLSARTRPLFDGIERADSFVVDPHKWLFTPFDCAALVYRDPNLARAALTQKAGYLEPLEANSPWNPSDLAIHMTRRARGLPLWFSLTTHGSDAYTAAVEHSLTMAQEAAARIRTAPHLELIGGPELSVVLFRRIGWSADEYQRWSEAMLAEGVAFVVPTRHSDETVSRLCFINPTTTTDDIDIVIASLA
jgi:glutamate/tyrosine decarboxylase-like PLP-dependent enzyme